jgi:5-bromo-4-chloroindolyl phosphate hydrolysis protein
VERSTVSQIYLHSLLKRRNVEENVAVVVVVIVEVAVVVIVEVAVVVEVVITNVDKAERLCYSQKERNFVKCKRVASVA